MVTRALFFDGILDGIGDAFRNIGDAITSGISNIVDGGVNHIVAMLLKLVYGILNAFFMIIDFITLIFRKMCGLDTVQINSSYSGTAQLNDGEFTGDLALALVQSQQIIDIFISLLIVAVILLFVFTFIAIIRNQYNPEKSKGSNGPIIGKALKALFTFIFVPAICIMGMMVSNALLRTIDGATRLNTETSISGQIFSAAASSANRVTTNETFWLFLKTDTNGINPHDMFTKDTSYSYRYMDERERAALAINKAFGMKSKLDNQGNSYDLRASYNRNNDVFKHMQGLDDFNYISYYDYMNTDLVWVYYDLTKFNWLLAFVSCFFVSAALIVAAIGIIQRIYEITILFAISPPFVALMPLDDGKAFQGWRKKFIEETIVMYGTVLALNFFFIVTPLLTSIDLFGSSAEIEAYGAVGCQLFNDIGHLLFIICGAIMIKESSGFLTGIIAGNDKVDLMARGESMQGKVRGTVGKIAAPYTKYRKWQDTKAQRKANDAITNGKEGEKKEEEKKDEKGGGSRLRAAASKLVSGAKSKGQSLKSKLSSSLEPTKEKMKFSSETAKAKFKAKDITEKRKERAQRKKDLIANANSATGVSDEAADAFASMFGDGGTMDQLEKQGRHDRRASIREEAKALEGAGAAGLGDMFGEGGLMDQLEAKSKMQEQRRREEKALADAGAAGLGDMFGRGGTMDQLEVQGRRERSLRATNEAKRKAKEHGVSKEEIAGIAAKRNERKKRAEGNTATQDKAIAKGMQELFGDKKPQKKSKK